MHEVIFAKETCYVLRDVFSRSTYVAKKAACTQRHAGHQLREEPDAENPHVRFRGGCAS